MKRMVKSNKMVEKSTILINSNKINQMLIKINPHLEVAIFKSLILKSQERIIQAFKIPKVKKGEIEIKEVAQIEAQKVNLMKNKFTLKEALTKIMNRIRDLMKKEN